MKIRENIIANKTTRLSNLDILELTRNKSKICLFVSIFCGGGVNMISPLSNFWTGQHCPSAEDMYKLLTNP
jgi:hypothetical protein